MFTPDERGDAVPWLGIEILRGSTGPPKIPPTAVRPSGKIWAFLDLEDVHSPGNLTPSGGTGCSVIREISGVWIPVGRGSRSKIYNKFRDTLSSRIIINTTFRHS